MTFPPYSTMSIKLLGGPEKLQGRFENLMTGGRAAIFPAWKMPPRIRAMLSAPSPVDMEYETITYDIDYGDPRYDGPAGTYYPAYFRDPRIEAAKQDAADARKARDDVRKNFEQMRSYYEDQQDRLYSAITERNALTQRLRGGVKVFGLRVIRDGGKA